MYEITFASDGDEEELREILTDCGMDLAGDIQEHVLIKKTRLAPSLSDGGNRCCTYPVFRGEILSVRVKKDNEIRGGGMLAQTDTDMFHLLVFAVRKNERNQGIGSNLLQELTGQPWMYCRGGTRLTDGDYRITTIAKGESAGFYEKNGFSRCDFSKLAYPFDQQCDVCPDRSDCNPAAMVFRSQRPGSRE